ncbi:unnamed protein product [Mytilus coruscus]|uniref:ATP-dependent DNA helicase n=1 Tax=Mytilus coruscus TaxID=42192 RepID=A0A6J8CL40_MYTCO|nr:unnamed protein product [Mytilus coruscus]
MVHKHVIECGHRTFCDIMECNDPFGGKIVMLGGDFRQVLPVIRHGRQADIVESNLKRITIIPSDAGLPFDLKRRQFIRPAFEITINKYQEQILDHIGLDLTESIFSHGQLCVALSRVRSFHSLTILPNKDSFVNGKHTSQNIVYKEVLNQT